MSSKRVLVCASCLPEADQDSGSRRLFDLMTALCEGGWSVSIASPQRDVEHCARPLQQRGIATYTGPLSEMEPLLSAGRFDLVLASFWHHAEPLLPLIRRLSPWTRILVDSVALHFRHEARDVFRTAAEEGQRGREANPSPNPSPKRRGESGGWFGPPLRAGEGLGEGIASQPQSGMLGQDSGTALARELNVYAAADGVLTVSRKEAELINDLTGDPHLARVVPDCENLTPSSVPFSRRQGILFVGNFEHRPDSAVRYLCEEIVPRIPRACLDEHPVQVVGNQLDETVRTLGEGLPGVRLVGRVPSLVPYLHRARVSVLPLRDGAGTKRNLLQSLAAGTPAVSTRVGIEGLDLRAEEHVLVADDAGDFARGITRLLQDEALWQRLARQGREQVLQSHGPEACRKQFLLALADVFSKEPKAGSLAAAGELRRLRVCEERGERRGVSPPVETSTGGLTPRRSPPAIVSQPLSFVDGSAGRGARAVPTSPRTTSGPSDVPPLVMGRKHRKKVLVLGIYLADQANNITDLVAAFADSVRFDVTQHWVALGGEAPTPEVAAVTARVIRDKVPKYQILNNFLASHDPSAYEYVVSSDDDIQVPRQFLDRFLTVQADLEFAIAQPARTGNSYVDHPIVEQQLGVLARQTLFVEVGPLASFHRSIYDLVFPFDLTSQMGWGYESVWALRLAERGLKMGIIDALPVEHSMRKPVANYSWHEADAARTAYLARHPHLPLEECFRVLDVISFEEGDPCLPS